ncbi:MAG: intradiol ring-cleavage dioxygenase [Gammaproteobacteria bacterium]|nr:intradiol ring-cleavage dioxygenase [Gammaproteobacteria bacterium]
MNPKRRAFLFKLTGLTLFSASSFSRALVTPGQSLGPFYPQKIPLDSDSDLTLVAGKDGRATGEITNLYGQLFSADSKPVPDARIEIWQCDAFRAYHHPQAGGGIDPYFQGYGKTTTDDEGRYRFKTIKPVPYPGRAPHIHFRISVGSSELITQIYVQGDSANDSDFLLNRVPDDKARQSLIIPFMRNSEVPGRELMAVFNPIIG